MNADCGGVVAEFAPMLTPKEMLSRGIFGGTYFSQLVDPADFPSDWFDVLEGDMYRADRYRADLNHFKVRSGQSQQEWEASGWIHSDDPRGWFEWYCKYHLGRRHEDDERQIKRWLAFCGPNGRWRNRIYARIHSIGCGVELSRGVSNRIQQSLLHWSYMVNDADYESWKVTKGISDTSG